MTTTNDVDDEEEEEEEEEEKNAREQDAARFRRLRRLLVTHLAVVRLVGELDVHPAQRVRRHGAGIGRREGGGGLVRERVGRPIERALLLLRALFSFGGACPI